MAGDGKKTDCSHLNLVQDHLDGRLPPSLDSEFSQHLQSCPLCRAELEALRAVQETLREAAEQALPVLDKRAVAEGLFDRERPGMGWLVPSLAAGAVAAAVVLAVVLWPVHEPVPLGARNGGLDRVPVVADVIPRPAAPVVVTYMTGEVEGPILSGLADARQAIEWPLGVEVRTGRGELVARADAHSTVALGPRSRAAVTWSDGWEVRLEQGSIAAALNPGRTRPFRVVSSAGSVEALGTRFVVEWRDAEHLGIGLREGKLALTTPSGVRTELGAPVQAILGPGGAADLGPLEDDDSGALALLDRPWPSDSGAQGTISLRSTPSAAEVLVDGRVMGSTPLAWIHPAQEVSIEVRAAGFKATRLALAVQPGQILERDLNLLQGTKPGRLKPAEDPLARVRKLLAAREVGRAQSLLDRYLERNPGDARGMLLQADAQRIAGQARPALTSYKKVAEQADDAQLAEAALYQAGLLQLRTLDEPSAALETFGQLRRSHPRGLLRQEVAFHLAECYLSAKDYRRALRALEDYLRLYPGGTKADQARTLVDTLREKGWK